MRALPPPARTRTLATAIAAALTPFLLANVPRALAAQSAPALSARTLMEMGPSSLCSLAMTGDVGASWDAVKLRLLSPPVTGRGPRTGAPVAVMDVASSPRRAWRVRASGAVGTSEPRCAAQSAWSRGWIETSRTISRGGVALAVGLKSLSALDPTRDRAGITASLWQQRGAGRWDVEMRAFGEQRHGLMPYTRTIMRPDSMRSDTGSGGWTRFFRPTQVQDSAVVAQRSNQVALSTRWRRDVGRTSFDLTFGGSGALGGSSRQAEDTALSRSPWAARPRLQWWARADTRITLGRYADLLVGVAALPSQPESGIRAGRVATIGLSFASGARGARAGDITNAGSFEVRRLDMRVASDADRRDSVTVRLRLRDGRAQRVDVSGEQFAWKPVSLTRVDAEWWEADVRMLVGTYRMSIRRDGKRWTAPPGFPVLRDEFGGEVALVTVR